uniref:G domain-containing protein n=1 Tax=Neobodo designis TaxID=312471 RepID=A0A7S1PTU4_NEODS
MAASKYDAVLKPSRFADVYDSAKGWKVETEDDCAAIKAVKSTIRIAPIGHFNVGKTFITNKLSGKALPTGEQHHTEGLSVTVTAFAGESQIAWMDTAGLNSPVVHCESFMQDGTGEADIAPADLAVKDTKAAAEHTQKHMADLQAALREVKRLEDFHRAAAFEFADVFLFVIGQMSHEDQLNIMQLVRQIEASQNSRKQVFVVHNLKDWDMDKLQKEHGDKYTYIERIRALFFMQQQQVTSEYVVDGNDELVVEGKASTGQERPVKLDIEKLFGTFGQTTNSAVPMHHVFLLNDEKEKLYNAAVLAHLRKALSLVQSARQSVMGSLEAVVSNVQANFAEVSSAQAPPLRFVKRDDAWYMHSVAKDAPGTALHIAMEPQPLELPSYLTLGSDDLQYDVVKFLGRVGAPKPGVGCQKKAFAGVQIVVPGMTPADVEKIRARIRFNGTDPALRLEKVEGAKTLMIDLDAVERVIPAHFLRKTWTQSQKQLATCDTEAISMESEEQHVVHEGSRSVFDANLERPVRVQVRTGLTKVSTLTKPVMAYNDGVLSIVVATSDKV